MLPVIDGRVEADRIAAALAQRCGARLVVERVRKGGWRDPKIMAQLGKSTIRPSTLTFALSLLQYKRTSQFERLRGFAKANGAKLARSSGLLRAANGTDKITGPGTDEISAQTAAQSAADPDFADASALAFRRTPPPSEVDDDRYNSDYWEDVFSTENPWDYTNDYEQTKYRQTLDLLPSRKIGRALELACAEGHFTQLLAPLVESLVATDISETALERAAAACADHANISYRKLDLRTDEIPGRFDLIVCSEVLYYIEKRRTMRSIARRIRQHLEPGGLVLMAHANVAANDPAKTGFDWGHHFDARSIGEVFQQTPGLRLVREARAELYRIQLFEHVADDAPQDDTSEITEIDHSTELTHYVSSQVQWNACAAHRQYEVTDRLPILMYHRVAPDDGATPGLDDYRVTPEQFDTQMRYLAEQGYYGTTLDAWERARARFHGLPGRAVVITFDDGYDDFYDYAWPILQRYGFPATVFVVPDFVGGRAEWDHRFGEPAPLMSWERIRELSRQGVVIGSHTMDHQYLTSLTPHEIAKQAVNSRQAIEQKTGRPVTSLAYPFGDHDEVVERVVAECGYSSAVNTNGLASRITDRPFSLGRIELLPSDGPKQMAAELPRPQGTRSLRRARIAMRNRFRQVQRDYL